MSEPVLTFRTQAPVGVARVMLKEIVHPEDLDRLSQEFRQYVAQSRLEAYVLDLSSLEYLTSAAIGMLLNMHAHLAAEGRRFAVAACNDMVVETLGHPHLDRVFPVCTDLDQARASVA